MIWRALCVLVPVLASLVNCVFSLSCPGPPRHLTDQGSSHPSGIPPLVQHVSVPSYRTGFPPLELFAFSYPLDSFCWCSGTAFPANVTVNLTEPLVIYGLLSGGYRTGYVNVFSLEYSVSDNGAVTADYLPQVFNVPDPGSEIPLVLFPRPIVAKTLYFRALSFERYDCWTLALLGCTEREAQPEQPSIPPSVAPSVTLSQALPSPSSSPTQQAPGSTQPPPTVNERRGEDSSVTVAVSTAVVTFLAVAVVVGLGVALCWAISNGHILARHKISINRDRYERDMTLRRVDNELYHLPQRGSGEGLLSSDELTSTVSTTVSHTAVAQNGEQEQGVYEPVQPTSDEEEEELKMAESLMDNAAYLATSVTREELPTVGSAGYEPVLSPSNGRYVTTIN